MASFEAAWPVLLAHEGGYTVDDGGPTNYGWTLGALAKIGVAMTEEVLKEKPTIWAANMYYQNYWNGFGDLDSQTVATKMLDMAVNMEDPAIGRAKGEAVTLGQKAVNSILYNKIAEDGVWGPVTVEAMNQITANDENLLVTSIISQQARFYRSLAASNPAQYERYLMGWLKRAAWPQTVVGV